LSGVGRVASEGGQRPDRERRADPGPDTLCTLARAPRAVLFVLACAVEPGEWCHCADHVLVRTVRCLP
jgi:hypothetical protein